MAEEAFYQGSINEAINKSQIERKLFVVSLQDDSNASKQLDSVTWTDAQVKTVLRNECIAIRLVKGTQQAEQFIQIYNPTQCPSIYFLAQGFPFLIIPGFVSASEFIQKYQGVKLAYSSALNSSLTSSNIGNPNPTSTSSTPVTTSSTNNSNNNYSAPRPSNEPKTTINPSNNSNSTKPVVSATNNNNSAADADLDDEEEARQLIMKQYKKSGKSADGTNAESRPLTQEEIDEQVKKYEEKLKEIRARKAKEKEEEERNKELERIKSAKEMQAARAKIEEIKRQKEIEKRKKEQEEEKAYKEKLRLQIQKDKEERERKAKQGLAESTDTSTNKTTYINASANNTNLTSIKSYDKTTLRFRLLNGETLVQEFPGDETLEGVVGFLNNAYNYRVKYSLKTVYPNHLFLPHEYSKTLKQLNLVPNATLILTEAPLNGSGPSGNASLSSSESSGSSWSPFSLIGSMWKWAWGSSDSSNNASTSTDTNYSSNTNTSSNQNTAQGQRNDKVRHRGAGPNVVSLGDMRRDGQGDDRHKSTWNGNSTQQQ